MRKINHIFADAFPLNKAHKQHNELSHLANNMLNYQLLQQFWCSATPKILSQSSFASSLLNGQLLVYANSAIVANKIKLTHMHILSQLQQLQNSNPAFRECKVTAISVKVQVKSNASTVTKIPRLLSSSAAASLNKLAHNLGESPLANQLKLLANKTNKLN